MKLKLEMCKLSFRRALLAIELIGIRYKSSFQWTLSTAEHIPPPNSSTVFYSMRPVFRDFRNRNLDKSNKFCVKYLSFLPLMTTAYYGTFSLYQLLNNIYCLMNIYDNSQL